MELLLGEAAVCIANQTVGHNYTSAVSVDKSTGHNCTFASSTSIQLKLTMRQVSPLPQPGITRRKNAAKKRLFANFVTSGNTSFIHPSARHRKKKKEKRKEEGNKHTTSQTPQKQKPSTPAAPPCDPKDHRPYTPTCPTSPPAPLSPREARKRCAARRRRYRSRSCGCCRRAGHRRCSG
jgi:hypothetical protein